MTVFHVISVVVCIDTFRDRGDVSKSISVLIFVSTYINLNPALAISPASYLSDTKSLPNLGLNPITPPMQTKSLRTIIQKGGV